MASSASQSSQQQRCVFVGNIPYDATEEQLIQICEEVGPVVSFRLVIDRETGKPKGYGFCEYKDEETALSARRNLQGYEINGRQLRVDFAENDKNADRNREQGRGGPGMATNSDPQRQFGGSAVLVDSSFHQPMGVSVAIAAATAMARALGAAQTGSFPNQIGLQSHQALGSDPLTLHLAKMSRIQLTEIMSELKAMATQNRDQARQLLTALPNLPKAIFQAQFMLGMVTQQMLQMPNIRQGFAQTLQPLLLDAQKGQEQVVQTLPGLPPLPPNTQFPSLSQAQDTHVFAVHPSSSVQTQHAALSRFPAYSQVQVPQGLQHGQLLPQPGISGLPSIRPQPLGNLPVRPHMLAEPFNSQKQQMLFSLPPRQSSNLGYNPQENFNKDSYRPQVSGDSAWASKPALPSGLAEIGQLVHDSSDPINRPSKLMRLNDGRVSSSSADINIITSSSGPPASSNISRNQVPIVEAVLDSEKQVSQMQLPPEVESALLQQVLSLTPEQLSSLPPDQLHQVIQLQQILRQST